MTEGSTTSTPTGSPARPWRSSSRCTLAATSSARPLSGDIAPRMVEMPAGVRSSSHGQYSSWWRAAEPKSHTIGWVAAAKKREAGQLVHRPRPDVGGCDVADVAHVEAEQRAHLGLLEQQRDPLQPLAPQPVEIDPLLPIDPHQPKRLADVPALLTKVVQPPAHDCSRPARCQVTGDIGGSRLADHATREVSRPDPQEQRAERHQGGVDGPQRHVVGRGQRRARIPR